MTQKLSGMQLETVTFLNTVLGTQGNVQQVEIIQTMLKMKKQNAAPLITTHVLLAYDLIFRSLCEEWRGVC